MRTATSDNYLTAGLAYAFHPHRDTWYSAPLCQVNWWLPVYEIAPDNAMAFHPRYWRDRKSTRLNSSHGYISYAVFCLKKNNSSERRRAVQRVLHEETRLQGTV